MTLTIEKARKEYATFAESDPDHYIISPGFLLHVIRKVIESPEELADFHLVFGLLEDCCKSGEAEGAMLIFENSSLRATDDQLETLIKHQVRYDHKDQILVLMALWTREKVYGSLRSLLNEAYAEDNDALSSRVRTLARRFEPALT